MELVKPTILPEHYRTMSTEEKVKRIRQAKAYFGSELLIPGHHYQREEVIQFADATGDSLQLAQLCAKSDAAFIVFCGVHFMAETADMLTSRRQTVLLPDLAAGCSMADMATHAQTKRAWKSLTELYGNTLVPLTYVNSTAAIKAFCGEHGGACLTSSNAKEMVSWALGQKERLLFLPDQHLGRNTAAEIGIPLEQMAVWCPHKNELERVADTSLEDIKIILWKGHCSVHEKFTVTQIDEKRAKSPDMTIIVHPECSYDVVQAADDAGSTHHIIQVIQQAHSGSKWAVGTEMNLVNRLAKQHPDKQIESLNPFMCPCLTMNRIDLEHLCWTLDLLREGVYQFEIKVPEAITKYAKVALDRMLLSVK
ncbi:quinolinate synthase NadA [Shouchella miscanthi]|uniref:Quinolinate synthase n=1 Tax=Shouchella miscanthi TaxID=2598861 RepID=A0ABU6NN28_9BACI|nr:quinolinate synthase NadA [Shouchella miscanthi]MED4129598.1 quinolinate synthase NadA [Shouchella miscanthi]